MWRDIRFDAQARAKISFSSGSAGSRVQSLEAKATLTQESWVRRLGSPARVWPWALLQIFKAEELQVACMKESSRGGTSLE